MQEELYKCSLCCKDYDLEARIPKTLSWCRHFLCLKCLKEFFKDPIQRLICPFCQRNFVPTPLNPEPFVTDLALLELVRKRTKTIDGYCSKHDLKEQRLFCITDKVPICSDCAKYGDHKNHEIQPIKVLQDNTTKKKEKLKFLLEGYDTKSRKIEQEINEKLKNLTDLVRNKFFEMRRILHTREQDLVQKIEGILRVEKEFLAEKLEGNKSRLKAQISEISQDNYQCQTLSSLKQELDGYENELMTFGVEEIGELEETGSETSNLLERFLRVISGLQQNGANEKCTQTVDNDDILEGRKLSREISTEDEDIIKVENEQGLQVLAGNEEDGSFLKQREIRNGEMEEEIEEGNDHEEEEELSVDSNEVARERIEEIENLLEVQDEGEKVKIDFANKEFCDEELTGFCSKFRLENQRMRHLEIDFSGSSLEDHHLEVLRDGLPRNIESFVFDCSNTSIGDACFTFLKDGLNLSAETLEKVELILDSTDLAGDNICDIFSKMNQLRHLKLSFRESEIFSAGISFLFSSLRHVACNLESLDLDFNATEIDDGCLEILINNVILSMKTPKYLRISLRNTNLSNKVMIKLFQSFKLAAVHLTTFELDLHNNGLYNTALTRLLEETLKEMVNLENLKLDLSGTKITNDGFKHVSLAPLNLKSLSMNLNDTHLTDQGLEILKKIVDGSRIEKLEVQLENAFVSDETLEKFGDYLRKKNKNQQNWNTKAQSNPKRSPSEYSPERDNYSVFSRESTPKRKMRFPKSSPKFIVPPLIKEKFLLDLKKALITETDSRLKHEEICMSKLLELIEKIELEIYNEILKKLLTKHFSAFRAKISNLNLWREKMRKWIYSLSNPNHWTSWLVANGKFSLFREKLIEILKSMPFRSLFILRQRVLKALKEIFLDSGNPKQISMVRKSACSRDWWVYFMTKNPDLQALWESLPRENPLFQEE